MQKRTNTPKTLLACALLLASFSTPALGQDGKPVSANPFVEVNINETSGCVNANATERLGPAKFCSDYDQVPTFAGDKRIQAAKQECLKFYDIALRLQNVFCSYATDADAFYLRSQASARAQVGKQIESVHVVAAENRSVAGINVKYMRRIAELGQEFYDQYSEYIVAIGDLSARAGQDVGSESSCINKVRPDVLSLSSTVPGHLRELLAGASQSNAYSTYDYMWKSVRENYSKLKQVKEEAESNVTRAKEDMPELAVPTVFETSISRDAGVKDKSKPMTPAEGAMFATFQDLLTRGIKAKFPTLAGASGSIIGGGIILVWQYHSNKRIMYPEAAATFIGMVNPYLGIAANLIVAAYRTSEARNKEYRIFSHAELKKNVNITATQLAEAWGKEKESENCVKSAQMEAQCVETRQKLPAYSGSNCAISAMDRQSEARRAEEKQIRQRQHNERMQKLRQQNAK